MTLSLWDIKEDVRKYAEVISNITKVDVVVTDQFMLRVAGTGIYVNLVGLENRGAVYRRVLKTLEPQIITNPREHEICQECVKKDSCIDQLEISAPIIHEEKAIGIIGLVCPTEKQKQIILGDLDTYMQFLYEIRDFICSKLYQHNESKMQLERAEVLKKILNNINKGVIVLDTQGNITILNNVAMEELKLSSGNLNYKVEIIDKDEYIINGQLYELKIDGKSYFLVGNIIHISSISKDYEKIFIFKNMEKISSDINEITSNQKRIDLDTIVGNSKVMISLKEKIKRITTTQSTVLITGESGTGKELVSRAIHYLSDRRDKPFVAVNCSAMPETLMESELFGYVKGAFTGANPHGKIGKFELANGGIIFLDEIGDMPIYMQAKLLRVLQEKTVTRIGSNQPIDLDIRVFAATNVDLEQRIKENKFREDLFYRLNVIPLEVPPLREREGDVELIMNKLIDKYNVLFNKHIHAIDEECKEILLNYLWPGNVRELQNTIEYMINIADNTTWILTKDMLPHTLNNKNIIFYNNQGEIKTLKELEQDQIKRALKIYGISTEGKEKAAEKLGIGIATIYRKVKELSN